MVSGSKKKLTKLEMDQVVALAGKHLVRVLDEQLVKHHLSDMNSTAVFSSVMAEVFRAGMLAGIEAIRTVVMEGDE